eukprot:TRINITY_DN8928_c0_g1_i1.p2 TRINITY_DN8928_c0_g1~~TRINITY_DN8928_c0_g1_i1.p2  ORF type:complete len:197 (-),score=-20.53 TRINITY_DN8928_c0_g1_i1:300-890(-)
MQQQPMQQQPMQQQPMQQQPMQQQPMQQHMVMAAPPKMQMTVMQHPPPPMQMVAQPQQQIGIPPPNQFVAFGDPNFYAWACSSLYNAMKGLGTNERLLIHILSKRTAAEMVILCDMYEKMYKRKLAKHLKSETSFSFQLALLSLVKPKLVVMAKYINSVIAGREANMIDVLAFSSNAEIQQLHAYFQTRHAKSKTK